MLKGIKKAIGIILIIMGLILIGVSFTMESVFWPNIVIGLIILVGGVLNILSNKLMVSQEDREKLEAIKDVSGLLQQKEKLEKAVIELSKEATMQSFGLYTPMYDAMESPKIKYLLTQNRDKQKEMIKDDTACNFDSNWKVNGSKQEGKRMTKNNIIQILRSFNIECDSIIDKVKYNNYTAVSERIYKSANQLNNMNKINKVEISNDYIELKQEELRLAHEYAMKVEEEKELQRQERELMREAKREEAELKVVRERLKKDETHLSTAIEDMKRNIELSTDPASKERYEQRLKELEENLKEVHTKQADVDYREKNQNAGYVYVISNIGSFGEDVYKIGVTRRLDPYERIQELSSASVPFKFDVHTMIFSPDAYTLETELHNLFNGKRVNKVNTRREFFRSDLGKIEEAIKKYSSAAFEMKYEPDAEEYRITKKMEQEELVS